MSPPLISSVIFPSELQVSGNLPDSAWELGELNFGLKSLEEHAANLTSGIDGAAGEEHTPDLLGLVSPAHIKCRSHFALRSVMCVPGASVWPGSNTAH